MPTPARSNCEAAEVGWRDLLAQVALAIASDNRAASGSVEEPVQIILVVVPESSRSQSPVEGPYLTIEETAKLLKVGEDTVERLIGSGQLNAIEISGKGARADRTIKRISREAIDEFARNSVVPPSPAPARRRPKRSSPTKDYF